MKVRQIRSSSDFQRVKDELEALMVKCDPASLGEREYLGYLLEKYEHAIFKIDAPTPIDAIRLRMDQRGLTLRDLEPHIGSRSRVSEVLSGKRPLSLDMVRALNAHLGIPAEVLIRKNEVRSTHRIELTDAMTDLLVRRGILRRGETLGDLLKRVGSESALPAPLFHRTLTDRANARTNPTALLAWTAAVVIEAKQKKIKHQFKASVLTPARLVKIAQISCSDDWANAVTTELANLGIVLVVMPHLPETYLDGAALLRPDGVPIVAVTLRHNRIDNFWFVLLHELSHLAKHFGEDEFAFFDDLDLEGSDLREKEADESARDALVPPEACQRLLNITYLTAEDIEDEAILLKVHPAIVAGRVRRDTADYRRFSSLIGYGLVHKAFPEYKRIIGDGDHS